MVLKREPVGEIPIYGLCVWSADIQARVQVIHWELL